MSISFRKTYVNPVHPVSIRPLLAAAAVSFALSGCGGKGETKSASVPPLPDPASQITALQNAIERARRSPRDPAAAFEAGKACGDMGRYGDAITWFHHMERLAPTEPAAITAQGQMWVAIGRPLMAARSYERALKLVPDQPLLRVELARAYTDLRDYQTAVSHGLQAEKLDPSGDAPQRSLASAYAEMLDGPKSQLHAKKAAQLHPEVPDNWLLLGSLLLRNGRIAESEAALQHALTLSPGNPAANTVYATALIQAHKTPDADRRAFAFVARARTADPGYAPAMLLQGQILSRAGRYADAAGVLRLAREADPRDPEIVRALGQALVRSGHGEQGVRLVTLSQKMPQRTVSFSGLENQALKSLDPRLVMRLAGLYERQEMFDLSQNVLEKAVQKEPGNKALKERLSKARTLAARLDPR